MQRKGQRRLGREDFERFIVVFGGPVLLFGFRQSATQQALCENTRRGQCCCWRWEPPQGGGAPLLAQLVGPGGGFPPRCALVPFLDSCACARWESASLLSSGHLRARLPAYPPAPNSRRVAVARDPQSPGGGVPRSGQLVSTCRFRTPQPALFLPSSSRGAAARSSPVGAPPKRR